MIVLFPGLPFAMYVNCTSTPWRCISSPSLPVYDFARTENFVSPISMRKWVKPSMRVAVVGDSAACGEDSAAGRGARDWLRLRVTTAARTAIPASSPPADEARRARSHEAAPTSCMVSRAMRISSLVGMTNTRAADAVAEISPSSPRSSPVPALVEMHAEPRQRGQGAAADGGRVLPDAARERDPVHAAEHAHVGRDVLHQAVAEDVHGQAARARCPPPRPPAGCACRC